jgi:hypothetical protein
LTACAHHQRLALPFRRDDSGGVAFVRRTTDREIDVESILLVRFLPLVLEFELVVFVLDGEHQAIRHNRTFVVEVAFSDVEFPGAAEVGVRLRTNQAGNRE